MLSLQCLCAHHQSLARTPLHFQPWTLHSRRPWVRVSCRKSTQNGDRSNDNCNKSNQNKHQSCDRDGLSRLRYWRRWRRSSSCCCGGGGAASRRGSGTRHWGLGCAGAGSSLGRLDLFTALLRKTPDTVCHFLIDAFRWVLAVGSPDLLCCLARCIEWVRSVVVLAGGLCDVAGVSKHHVQGGCRKRAAWQRRVLEIQKQQLLRHVPARQATWREVTMKHKNNCGNQKRREDMDQAGSVLPRHTYECKWKNGISGWPGYVHSSAVSASGY